MPSIALTTQHSQECARPHTSDNQSQHFPQGDLKRVCDFRSSAIKELTRRRDAAKTRRQTPLRDFASSREISVVVSKLGNSLVWALPTRRFRKQLPKFFKNLNRRSSLFLPSAR